MLLSRANVTPEVKFKGSNHVWFLLLMIYNMRNVDEDDDESDDDEKDPGWQFQVFICF